jgi:hypothetical protein
MKNNIFFLILVFGLSACSSKKAKNEGIEEVDNSDSIKKDYIVNDASHTIRPIWVSDAETWAHDKDEDTKKFRYYSYETDPKNSREISCQLANANAKAVVAGEITTFIQKNLASSQEGVAAIDLNNPKNKSLTDYVENTLAEKIEAMIHGAQISKTYWEKRSYQKDLGAKSDFVGFTCAALIKMPKSEIKTAIENAKEVLVTKVADAKTKENVAKAMKNIEESYIEVKTGQR